MMAAKRKRSSVKRAEGWVQCGRFLEAPTEAFAERICIDAGPSRVQMQCSGDNTRLEDGVGRARVQRWRRQR